MLKRFLIAFTVALFGVATAATASEISVPKSAFDLQAEGDVIEVAALNRLHAKVDLSEQRMKLFVGGKLKAVWKVSSGTDAHKTPTGKWHPYRTHVEYYSRKYNNAPMPYSVFFHGGYAVHGTSYNSRLGRTASHGCIRLHTQNAKTFLQLVRKYGYAKTTVEIVQ